MSESYANICWKISSKLLRKQKCWKEIENFWYSLCYFFFFFMPIFASIATLYTRENYTYELGAQPSTQYRVYFCQDWIRCVKGWHIFYATLKECRYCCLNWVFCEIPVWNMQLDYKRRGYCFSKFHSHYHSGCSKRFLLALLKIIPFLGSCLMLNFAVPIRRTQQLWFNKL